LCLVTEETEIRQLELEKVVWPKIVSTKERAIAGVSYGQFGAVRLKFKLSAYIQETVGGR